MQIDTVHYFDLETRQKIGATTYIVTAHFDEKRENLTTAMAFLSLSVGTLIYRN